MEIYKGLKKVIFKKLYEDLSHVEIIPYENSIWFIDRENEYWFFEYEKSGKLWWRYGFFESFFGLFSLESNVYQSIISEWVEEVLNYKVETTQWSAIPGAFQVEEVLNYKVETTSDWDATSGVEVEEVLNYKVETTPYFAAGMSAEVEEVLNYKVETPHPHYSHLPERVEEVLNYKVETPSQDGLEHVVVVREVLGIT